MNIFRLTAVAVSLTLFSACGGGGGGGGAGGGGGGGGGVVPEPLPRPLVVNASQARSFVGGGAPQVVSANIRGELERRAQAADTLLASEIAGTLNNTVECMGRDCTRTILDSKALLAATTEFSPDDIVGIPQVDEHSLTRFNEQYSAIMTAGRVTLAERLAAGRSPSIGAGHQHQSYGGWLDNSVFAVQFETSTNGTETITWLSSYTFGSASGNNPTSSGSTNWNGVMVGAEETGAVVHGEAGISINVGFASVNVTFSNIKNLNTGVGVTDIHWPNLTLANGSFSDGNDSIRGIFYGINHDEVGGIFDRDSITGAFGAARAP